jgi:hypothetical protein
MKLYQYCHNLLVTVAFTLRHMRHHKGVHAQESGTLLVIRGTAYAKLAADIWYRKNGFNSLQGSHDLNIDNSQLLHAEFPIKKILLLGHLVYRKGFLFTRVRSEGNRFTRKSFKEIYIEAVVRNDHLD